MQPEVKNQWEIKNIVCVLKEVQSPLGLGGNS